MKRFVATVKRVGAIVFLELICFSVQREFGLPDSIGHSADDATKVRI